MKHKNTSNERDIQDLLTPDSTPKPPAGLAERIKAEIPDSIDVGATPKGDDGMAEVHWPARRRPARNVRPYLLAATILTAFGAAFLAYRLQTGLAPESLESLEPTSSVARSLDDQREAPAAAAEAAKEQAQLASADADTAGDRKGDGEAFALRGDDVSAGLDSEPEPKRVASPAPAASAVPAEGLAEQNRRLERQERRRAAELQEESRPRPTAPASAPPPIQIAGGLTESTMKMPTDVPEDLPTARVLPGRRAQTEVRREEEELAQKLRALGYVAGAEAIAPAGQYRDEVSVTPEARERVMRRLAEVPPPGVPPSTGGTTEPNDKPYGDVFFEGYGTNPFIDTEDDRLSTFGLDVDTASYTVVRRYLRDGHLPEPDAVRVEEMVNYFDYGDPAPEEEDFALYAEGAPSPFGEGERYYLLRFHLKGNELDPAERRPANITFVVDVSGSMARENRLGLVKRALELMIGQLREDDRVALVVYGSRGRVILEPTSDHERLRRAIAELRPEGSTNAEEGLTLAYDLAARAIRRGTTNRVILCSDGVANVGRTSAESILDRIGDEADRGVELTTVGFGMGNYNDVLMEQLANRGNGRYAYVDTLDEARRIFVENLTGTLQTIAAEARVQVDFNPEVVERYRLLGYENRDIADERFRDDTVDAGEIGAGHTVTALYELKLKKRPARRDHVATLHLRYGSIVAGEMKELSRQVSGADFARGFEDASPQLRLTAVVAEFAEILKRTYWARGSSLDDLFARAQRISADYPGDHEVAEFVTLVSQAARASR